MTAAYDLIAEQYRTSKTLPFRTALEEHTLFRLLGDVRGLHVLDLACGEGIYARKVMARGAASVLGVDVSPEMVRLGAAAEEAAPLGCRYRVDDVATLDGAGSFDVVMGVYLLNYARTVEELAAFCRAIARNLKPGGRFVGFNDNPANPPERFGEYAPYGFVKSTAGPWGEGAAVTYTLTNPDGAVFRFDNYHLAPATYARVFAEAGLRGFRWEGPWLDDAADRAFAPGYWEPFLAHPPMIGVTAVR